MTAFVNITAALVARLVAAPAVSANIFRARDRPMAAQYVEALSVQWEGGESSRGAMHGAPVDWLSKFTVECYARATGDVTPDVAVDPLLAGVAARIAADTTLGGLVADVWLAGLEAEYNAEGQKTGWIRMTYLVQHRTSNLTLE